MRTLVQAARSVFRVRTQPTPRARGMTTLARRAR